MRNPSIWYSEDPMRDRAIEHLTQLHDDWAVANRRAPAAERVPGSSPAGRSHGIRFALGHAAVTLGRAIAGPDALDDAAECSDEWPAAA